MKKYLVAFLAFVIALASVAFTSIGKTARPATTGYYWFEGDSQVDPGPLVAGDYVPSLEGLSKIDAMDAHEVCPDDTQQPYCLLGYEFSQLDFPENADPVVKENESPSATIREEE